MTIDTIIFDFGGVLIDWNPVYYYSTVFDDKKEMEWFLSNVCTHDWNLEQDRGRTFAEGIKLIKPKYPQYARQIEDYYNKWEYMLKGEIPGTVSILNALKKRYKVYGLTNWSAETFPIAVERFGFLRTLDGIVVSGEEKLIKPDKRIFRLLLNRYGLKAESCLFIDDNAENVETAQEMGFNAIRFTNARELKKQLQSFNISIPADE